MINIVRLGHIRVWSAQEVGGFCVQKIGATAGGSGRDIRQGR